MSTGNGSIATVMALAQGRKVMPKNIVSNTWTPAGYLGPDVSAKIKQHKEKKKMGWFRKKFNNWVRQAWVEAREEAVDAPVRGHDSINGSTSVRFAVYPASGGYVIEHYKQDRYRDSDGPQLTIVNNGDSLGTAVEHILTMEALKS